VTKYSPATKDNKMGKTRDVFTKIQSMVQIILQNIDKRHPNTVQELMQNNGPKRAQRSKSDATEFELLRASLGLIFEERYGWTEATIDSMTLAQVFIALEHAMSYDAPLQKSVWNL
jgi:hypothetical protein